MRTQHAIWHRLEPEPAPSRSSRWSDKFLAGLLIAVVGCSEGPKAATSAPPVDVGSSLASELSAATLAVIGEARITIADLTPAHEDLLARLETRYLRARQSALQAALDEVLRDQLLRREAKRRGITVDDLVAREAGSRLEPTSAEIVTWFGQNHTRLSGRKLPEVETQIADYLRETRRDSAKRELSDRLMQHREVEVLLQPFRAAVEETNAPSLGRADAPVTLVEFSDFQCPYCRQFQPTLKRLVNEFGADLRVVYRHFPVVQLHPDAFNAAKASLCAQEQSRFWEMHDLMFEEQDRLSLEQLEEKAVRLGLDRAVFAECLASDRHVAQIETDVRAGNRADIAGTPALFVNGILLDPGAIPYEVVAAAIGRELERLNR